jgi:hypothetical protein
VVEIHEQEIEVHVGVDIGCIECGESSALVAINIDRSKVQRALKRAEERQAANWQGQHSFEIFSATVKLKIPVEY